MGFVSFFGLATMMYSLTVRGTQALVSFAPCLSVKGTARLSTSHWLRESRGWGFWQCRG